MIAEAIGEAVGAAVLAIAYAEEGIAHEALALTDPEHWVDLEWITQPERLDRWPSVWPRAIACRWEG